jgi:dTDP-4-dehydrorhamnose reductase
MQILLTGITGNLGHEVARDLSRRNISIIPCVRNREILHGTYPEIVACDLTEETDIQLNQHIDAIIHCAGIVHFHKVHNQNDRMMQSIVKLSQKLDVPVYFTSTAFVYGGDTGRAYNNAYEQDKARAEETLSASGVPHTIFRPGVLTGNSRTGEIQNFSGYYLIAEAVIRAARALKEKGQTLRFPTFPGISQIVPVDQAATAIGDAFEAGKRGTLYLTNPEPPSSEWLLHETLDFFDLTSWVSSVEMSFKDLTRLSLSEEEKTLYQYAEHFSPYWGMSYDFPPSALTENLIDRDYVFKILSFFREKRSL